MGAEARGGQEGRLFEADNHIQQGRGVGQMHFEQVLLLHLHLMLGR
jgi:hypothetical protein